MEPHVIVSNDDEIELSVCLRLSCRVGRFLTRSDSDESSSSNPRLYSLVHTSSSEDRHAQKHAGTPADESYDGAAEDDEICGLKHASYIDMPAYRPHERTIGADGKQAVEALNTFVHVFGQSTQSGTAEEAHAVLWKSWKARWSSRHLTTITCRRALATLYNEMGDPAAAARILEAAWTMCRDVHGVNDAETLAVTRDLVSALVAAGESDHAEGLLWQTYDELTISVGVTHRSSAFLLHMLGDHYDGQDMLQHAIASYKSALAIYDGMGAACSRDAIIVCGRLAAVSEDCGEGEAVQARVFGREYRRRAFERTFSTAMV